MKICKTDGGNIQLIQQYQRSDKATSEPDAKVSGNPIPEETVNLSTTATDIQQIRNQINQLPDVRTEKVEDLKNQIDQGTYQVQSGKVAEKMVGESLLDIMA